MSRVLTGAGLFADTAGHTAEEIYTALRSTPRHRHVLRRWLRALTSRGRLSHDDAAATFGGLHPTSAADLEHTWQRATALEREVGWSTELLEVMRTCADRLPELISGDLDIRALLFPGGGHGGRRRRLP